MTLAADPITARGPSARRPLRLAVLDMSGTTVDEGGLQDEAFAVADRVGVMSAGRLLQLAPPHELRAHPATPEVEEFLA